MQKFFLLVLIFAFNLSLYLDCQAFAENSESNIVRIIEEVTSKKPSILELESNVFIDGSDIMMPDFVRAGTTQEDLDIFVNQLKDAAEKDKIQGNKNHPFYLELIQQLEKVKTSQLKTIKTVGYEFEIKSQEDLEKISKQVDDTKYRAFISKTTFDIIEPKPGEFKTVKIQKAMVVEIDSLENLLKLFGTPGFHGLNCLGTHAGKVRKLVIHWDKSHGVVVQRIEPGILSIKFKREPKDYNVLVSQIVSVWPDYLKDYSKAQRIGDLKVQRGITLSLGFDPITTLRQSEP